MNQILHYKQSELTYLLHTDQVFARALDFHPYFCKSVNLWNTCMKKIYIQWKDIFVLIIETLIIFNVIWILSLKKDTSACFLIIQKAILNLYCYCLKLYLSTVIWMDSSSGQNLLLYRTSGVICSVIRLPIIRHRSPDTLCPWDGMATDSSTSIALSAVGVVTSSIFLVWWEQHLRILMRHCLFLSIWTCTIYTNKSTACIKDDTLF